MAYVMIEGYLCERCGYRWGTRSGTGIRTQPDPAYCPKCKTKYWNRARRKEMPLDRQAKPWNTKTPETAQAA